MKLLVLILWVDWNDKQNLENLISDFKFEIWRQIIHLLNMKISITMVQNILPWRSLRAKRVGSSVVFINKFPLFLVRIDIHT